MKMEERKKMKAWNSPVIEELKLNQTAFGGRNKNEHDGVWHIEEDGTEWEATWPNSGEHGSVPEDR